jgi:ABC-2 type transport system ATP-binding protein
MLVVRGLCKTWGRQPALYGVTLTLRREDGITAILGANGSGKSTLLRVLATAISPDSGWLSFDNLPYTGDLRPLRQHIGYLPQDVELPDALTPYKVLRYLARLKGIHQRDSIDELVEKFGLHSIVYKPIGRLSGGQQRMVSIAQAFIGQPRLLLLDEVLRGLDAIERERVVQALRVAAVQAVVLFSSHIPMEAERIAQQMIVLKNGVIMPI